jgi:hypothetical protein
VATPALEARSPPGRQALGLQLSHGVLLEGVGQDLEIGDQVAQLGNGARERRSRGSAPASFRTGGGGM